MRLNSHAGHGKQDSKSCGATGIVKESVENRLLNTEFINVMRKENNTVYDCTVDYPGSKQDCLNKIISKCNSNKVDLDVSHHLNSGRNDYNGDGSIGGVEVWVYSNKGPAYEAAVRVCARLEKLGFKNRGVKIDPNYFYLNKTKSQAMIIEYYFVDDKDDCNLYNKLGYKALAKAVVEGVLGKSISYAPPTNSNVSLKDGDYANKKARVVKVASNDVLNVRYDRNHNSNIVGSLKPGAIVTCQYNKDGWMSIDGFKGNKGLGYVNSAYLELI